jgi:hypothetical protein
MTAVERVEGAVHHGYGAAMLLQLLE